MRRLGLRLGSLGLVGRFGSGELFTVPTMGTPRSSGKYSKVFVPLFSMNSSKVTSHEHSGLDNLLYTKSRPPVTHFALWATSPKRIWRALATPQVYTNTGNARIKSVRIRPTPPSHSSTTLLLAAHAIPSAARPIQESLVPPLMKKSTTQNPYRSHFTSFRCHSRQI